MKNISKSFFSISLLALSTIAQIHPAYDRQTVSFSPANLFTPQSTNASQPLVGGMDIFPDGRVAIVEWGVPGSVFILSGLGTSPTGVKVTRFAKGLDNALGLKIVNNVIYVLEKEGLTQLIDINNDGIADEYNSINESFPSDNGMLNFSYDLGYLNGSFYAALSSDVHIGGLDWGSGKYPGSPAFVGRSTMYQLNMDGTSSAIACGFRNPNGMWMNGNDIFVTDNQGSWLPSSKVINVKAGRFYGHQTNPVNACQTANNNVESPPLIWNNWDNDDETGRSSGNGVVLQNGIFAGQMLVGDGVDYHKNKVFRVFVEKINGELQGAVLPFINYGPNGVMRINEAPSGSIYLGQLGNSGGWRLRSGMASGFDILKPNGKIPFDILAVRNLGNSSFDVQFTKPVGASAGVKGNYTVKMWQQIPEEAYGAGNQSNVTPLTVNSATISADKLHVTLAIPGLAENRQVKFNFANIVSEDASTLYSAFAAYTLNHFGPGTDYKAVSASIVKEKFHSTWKLFSMNGIHLLNFFGDSNTPHDIGVYNIRGEKKLEMKNVKGSEARLETGNLSKGLYLVRVSEGQKVASASLVIQ